MEQIQLTSNVRTATGKSAARQLRREGLTPAVLYGGSLGNISLTVDSLQLHKILAASGGETALINLQVADEKGTQTVPVIIKDYQLDPVARTLLHADFMEVTMGQALETHVPIETQGTSPGVKLGGVLEFVTRELTIECLPSKMLSHVELDISSLEIGSSLTVEDIKLGEDYKILTPADTVVVTVSVPSAEEAETEEDEEELTEPEVIQKGKKPEEEE
ncbi:50S ribosomal protein L25 [candidate division KSB3 bacterium]|uniref:Large ribosomal subunit protein bL25 n=1 Tax=candidate division KSB3 bacterium TaxID=2044937 RepID=A0A2G6KEN9_9BACT|nr:MAG: 50S ribosomal protein L25 [candidate division KSB3 bacterium]